MYLTMLLDGHLQSWGLSSTFDERDTSNYPTKSGVIGILAASLGIKREDWESLPPLCLLNLTVFKVKRGSVYSDLQIAQNVPNALAEKTRKIKTVKTMRNYLIDAKFIAVLKGNDSLLAKCAKALDNPVFFQTLGRRNCIPSNPILLKLCESKNDLCDILIKEGVKNKTEYMSDSKKSRYIQKDVPVVFNKIYNTRFVDYGKVEDNLDRLF